MTESLKRAAWSEARERSTPYRDADGEIDIAAYWQPGPMLIVDIVLGVLAWILIAGVVWGVYAVTP